MKNKSYVQGLLVVCAMLAAACSPQAGNELVVYSERNEQLIKPLFDAYSAESGSKIRFITDKAGPLLARLKAEGKNTPADVLITVDAGNLWKAAQDGVLAPVESKVLQQAIPASLRDPQNRWFGVSVRARTIVYSTERVKAEDLSTYEALGEPKWKGRLCLRTSKKVYNQSLVAMMIAQLGEQRSEEIVRAWVANLATDVFSNDTALMKAIVAGQCDVGIVNTYYYGRLAKAGPETPLALFWPNQAGRGVHVNISGVAVTRHAKHRQQAIHFLEWLASDKAQQMFANANMEYPANPKIAADASVQAWGKFKQDGTNLAKAGELQVEAVKLMDRAGYK